MHACIIGHQVSFNNISGFENKLIQRPTSSQDLSPTELFNHHHCLVSKHFITPKRNPDPLAVITHDPGPWHPLSSFVSLWICLVGTFYINIIIQYVGFYNSCVTVGIMFLHFIYVIICSIGTSFLFMAK